MKKNIIVNSDFFGAFTTNLVSEFGDKTFIISMILAIKYNKLVIFLGSVSAHSILDLLVIIMGKFVTRFSKKIIIDSVTAFIFGYFSWQFFKASQKRTRQEGK